MALYNHFSNHYDRIFPVKEMTVAFLSKHMLAGRVLDLGCATGGYVSALTNKQFHVFGIDLDAAMIEQAKEKYPEISTMFSTGNMCHFETKLPYQAIYCIGNTLVHLPDSQTILLLLKRIYRTLEENGTCILQIVNYERIRRHSLSGLPTISQDGITFKRSYQSMDGYIDFSTELIVDKQSYVDHTRLLPLERNDLEALLIKAGFSKLQWYGGFDESSYDGDQSMACIVVAKK